MAVMPQQITVIVPASGDSQNYYINLNPGKYWVNGLSGHDYINTNSLDDTVIGGNGRDIVVAQAGNDLIYGDNLNEGGEGFDFGSGFGSGLNADSILGMAGNDIIYAQSGWDYVNGGAGEDTIYGGVGDDCLQGGLDADLLRGGSGNDTLRGDFSAAIPASYVFTIDLTFNGINDTPLSMSQPNTFGDTSIDNAADTIDGGAGNDSLFGAGGADTLLGGDGNDLLDGGAGADVLEGGLGNDTYILGGDINVVFDTGGIDTITSTIGRSLAAHAAIENLVLLSGVSGTGNSLANAIAGNASSNKLTGLGNADRLTGRGGNDTFVYNTAADSTAARPDTIKDFDDLGNDKIDLSAVDPGTLAWRGKLAFTGAHQIRIKDVAGPDVLVEVNLGGSLARDMVIRLDNTTAGMVTASDFIL